MTSIKTALLVIDVQDYFSSMAIKCLPNILKLCQHFSINLPSSPIIVTQHGHTEEELTTEPSPSQLVRRWGPANSIARGGEEWELVDEVKEFIANEKKQGRNSVKIIQKNTYDAFINTDLASFLDQERVERVVVCGCMTDACCDTTARSAFNRGFETWMISDGCGSANKKQHELGLAAFNFICGGIMKTSEVLESLEATGR